MFWVNTWVREMNPHFGEKTRFLINFIKEAETIFKSYVKIDLWALYSLNDNSFSRKRYGALCMFLYEKLVQRKVVCKFSLIVSKLLTRNKVTPNIYCGFKYM